MAGFLHELLVDLLNNFVSNHSIYLPSSLQFFPDKSGSQNGIEITSYDSYPIASLDEEIFKIESISNIIRQWFFVGFKCFKNIIHSR